MAGRWDAFVGGLTSIKDSVWKLGKGLLGKEKGNPDAPGIIGATRDCLKSLLHGLVSKESGVLNVFTGRWGKWEENFFNPFSHARRVAGCLAHTGETVIARGGGVLVPKLSVPAAEGLAGAVRAIVGPLVGNYDHHKHPDLVAA